MGADSFFFLNGSFLLLGLFAYLFVFFSFAVGMAINQSFSGFGDLYKLDLLSLDMVINIVVLVHPGYVFILRVVRIGCGICAFGFFFVLVW